MSVSIESNEIKFDEDVYETIGVDVSNSIRKTYAIGRKVFGELWNSMILNPEDFEILNEKISVGNGELNPKSMTEIIYVLTNLLPKSFRLGPNSCVTDLGSGYGMALANLVCQTRQKCASYTGIEIEKGRLEKSQEFMQKLGFENVTIIKDSFNNLSNSLIFNAMQSTTHFFTFDWVFTDDTLSKLALFLDQNRSNWKVFVSFRSPKVWSRFGLHAKYFGKLSRRKMHNQSMTAYFYLNKI